MTYSLNGFKYRKSLPLTVSVEQTDYGANEVYCSYMTGASNYSLYSKSGGTGSGTLNLGTGADAYKKHEIRRNASTSNTYLIDGTQLTDKTTNVPTASLNIIFSEYNSTIYVDWILVRKYTATEPTCTVGETESVQPTYTPTHIVQHGGAQA